jgi:hypothetical protein
MLFKSAGPAGARKEPVAGASKHFSKALQERRSSRSKPRTSGWCEQVQVQKERAKNQRFREMSVRKDEPVNSGDTQGASTRRRSQTLGVRTVQAEEREGIRGRPSAAGRTYEKVAFSGVKGGGAFRILQSKRFEHPYAGNCTARHRARTHSGTTNAHRTLRLYADLRRIHTG